MKLCLNVKINGAKTNEEESWAEKIGIESYSRYASVANRIILPVYNWTWDRLYPKDNMSEHPNYEKVYGKIARSATKLIVFIKGGYCFKNKRKIVVNPLFDIIPTGNNDEYVANNMIFIEDI